MCRNRLNWSILMPLKPMPLKILTTLAAGTVFLLSVDICTLAAAELKVSGAPAVSIGVINSNKAAIEKETGLTLNITANGDGNGLKDLSAGKADVAMVAAPIKITEAAMNKATPDSLNVAGMEVAPVGTLTIRFIVNPANPVKSLTEAQLKDIFTGKITSWKDVGGADQPILVVAEVPGFGARSSVVTSFLGGAEMTDKARQMQAVPQVAQVVAQVPTAIGYGNQISITPAVAVIPGVEIPQPLGLVTKGAPNADVKKLIEATAKYGAAVK
jgi:phosphate transport system substrate-binding protein